MTAWGPEEVEYVWHGGQRIYDGDLVLSPGSELPAPVEGRAREPLLSMAWLRWAMDPSTGVVEIPYEINNTGGLDATLLARTRDRIRRAMDHWETYVRRPDGARLLRFVPHAGETRWVELQVKRNGGVCYVNLNATGRSRVDSDPGCGWQTYVHEIGHVLTYRHEQKRSDRPDHVNFYAGRTDEDAQFTMVRGGSFLDTDYDSYSIMHYPSCMFALSRCNSSTPGAWVLERQRGSRYISNWWDRPVGDVLSPGDVCGTKTLYGLPCTYSPGGGVDGGVAADAGSGGAIDGGVAIPDAGPSDAGVPTPAVPPTPGMLQHHATGVALCAAPSGGATVSLAPCDELDAGHRWGLAPTSVLRNEGSTLCAEPASVIEGAVVEQRDCRPDGQRWRFGDVELVNGASGTCVSVPSGNYASGQRLEHEPCSGQLHQRFAFLPDTHELKAQGWCLAAGDTAGANVRLLECDGSAGQRWIESGGGFAAGGLCLRVQGGPSAAPGAPVEVTSCNGAVGQMWGLRGRVASAHDDLCLSATGSGAPLTLAPCAAAEVMTWWPRASCGPLGCADLGASCGSFDDACGAELSCGECPTEPNLDGGPGEFEECFPASCADLGACGPTPDGCGGSLDCDACEGSPTPEGCGCSVPGSTPGSGYPAAWFTTLVLVLAAGRRRSAPRRRA